MKLLRWVKTIASRDGKLHFKRFAIFESERFSIYIHRIYEGDKDEFLHSHPWRFWGIVLNGSYLERYRTSSGSQTRELKPFKTLKGDLDYYHKIERILNGPVTTLFIVGQRYHTWFYDVNGTSVEHDVFRRNKERSK